MRRSLVAALGAQRELVDRIPLADLSLESPCAGWSVRDVLNHSVGVTRKFADFAIGRTDSPRTPAGDLLGDDHRRAVELETARAQSAWHGADMTRTCRLSWGAFPASLAAGINLFDVLAHSWDVAAGTGRTVEITDELWEVGLRAARQVIGPSRDTEHYAPEVLVGGSAPPAVRFLAFLGRPVGASPGVP